MMTIADATSPEDLIEVRKLMRAFIGWHRERHRDETHMIDRYFDPAAFETELNGLPGYFSRPKGRLLLARHENQPAGCVALRALDAETCEMKRMFVYDAYHGKGIGRALGRAVITEARKIGYRVMRLDTGAKQVEAQALYGSLGFRVIRPYYELPDDLRTWLVFMELDLT